MPLKRILLPKLKFYGSGVTSYLEDTSHSLMIKSISFMFDNSRKSKIKNDKICHWHIELSQFKFSIVCCPGTENTVANKFFRISALTHMLQDHHNLPLQLYHPGGTHLFSFIRTRNLLFSLNQIRIETNSCTSCQYLKPKFITNDKGILIKAIQPFQLPSSISKVGDHS